MCPSFICFAHLAVSSFQYHLIKSVALSAAVLLAMCSKHLFLSMTSFQPLRLLVGPPWEFGVGEWFSSTSISDAA